MHAIRLTVAAGLLAAVATAQSSIVIPNGMATVEGNSSNAFPWGRGTSGLLHQAIYDASNFTLQGISSPILIQGLRWRPNTGVSLAASSYSQATVSLSTAPFGSGVAPSSTLAANQGADLTLCYSGPVSWPATTGGTGPQPFDIDVPLQTPFVYDPSVGDLNIECDLPIGVFTGTGPQLDVQTTGSLASRVYVSTGYPGTGTGTIGTSHGVVVEVVYVPAQGLFPAFSATPTSGTSPLNVQFTDMSYSSDPVGIVGWLWDIDNDGTTDYTTQNPMHTYTSCGTYSVSLTVLDASGTATETKTDLIVVDGISPDFTVSAPGGFAPVSLQFTDTSTGPVAAWLWDVDNDGVTDYTTQNPSHVYATPGTYSVSLTIINACNTLTETKVNLITVLAPGAVPAPPEILQYQFNETSGQMVANTATTNVMASHGLVTGANWHDDPGRRGFKGNEAGFGCLGDSGNAASLDNTVNTLSPLAVTGSMTISWWQRMNLAPGTTIGYTFGGTGSSVRCFTGGVAGNSLWYRSSPIGDVMATYDVQANPGVWEHVCLVIDDVAGTATWYFNGVQDTVTNYTPGIHTISLTEFHWGYQTTTSAYSRYYDTDDLRIYSRPLSAGEVLVSSLLGEHASASTYGTSCAGPAGAPVASGNGVPTIGNVTYAMELSNAENGRLSAIVFGFQPAGFGSFNIDPWLNGPGCELQVDNFGLNFHMTAGGGASQPFPLPAWPVLKGLHIYSQWIINGTQGAVTPVLDTNIGE